MHWTLTLDLVMEGCLRKRVRIQRDRRIADIATRILRDELHGLVVTADLYTPAAPLQAIQSLKEENVTDDDIKVMIYKIRPAASAGSFGQPSPPTPRRWCRGWVVASAAPQGAAPAQSPPPLARPSTAPYGLTKLAIATPSRPQTDGGRPRERRRKI